MRGERTDQRCTGAQGERQKTEEGQMDDAENTGRYAGKRRGGVRHLHGIHRKEDPKLPTGKPVERKKPRRMVGHPAGLGGKIMTERFPPPF